MTLKWHC